MAFPCIYTDEDVNPLLAEILKERGYSATTTKNCKMLGCSDRNHLEYTAQKHYVVLTHNIRDFCALAQDYAKKQLNHAGIILAPQWELARLLKASLQMLNDWRQRDPANHVIWLHRYAGSKPQ